MTQHASRSTELRIDTPSAAVRDVVRERWTQRFFGLALCARMAWWVFRHVGGDTLDLVDVGVTVFLTLAILAFLVGQHLGAPLVGARHAGKAGTVRLGEDELMLDVAGRIRRFGRAEIASGWTERDADGADHVVLQMRGGTLVRFQAADEQQARACVYAAGVAPEHRALRLSLGVEAGADVRIMRILFALLVAIVGALFTALGVVGLAIGASYGMGVLVVAALTAVPLSVAATLLALHRLLRPLVPSTLHIGTDGLVVERLFRRRFIPRASLLGVEARDNRIAITLVDGDGPILPVSSALEAGNVVRRIQEALAPPRGAGAAARARLDRAGRPIRAWLRDARGLLDGTRGAVGYRGVPLDREDLRAVVEDGAAPAEQRIAAAAALGGDREGRALSRIAAQACADDRLRIAIEEASGGEGELEEARIEEALRAEGSARG